MTTIAVNQLKTGDTVVIDGSHPYEPAEMIMRVIYVALCEQGHEVVMVDENNNYHTKHRVVEANHQFTAHLIFDAPGPIRFSKQRIALIMRLSLCRSRLMRVRMGANETRNQ